MLKLSDDKRTLVAQIDKTLSPSEVQTLISDLAELRANMLPPVPRERAQLVDETGDGPNVSMQNDPDAEVRLLRDGRIRFWFRNSGLGWLVFNVPTDKACAIRDYLIANTPEGHTGPNLFSDDGTSGNAAH
jgi:hypothetical protein